MVYTILIYRNTIKQVHPRESYSLQQNLKKTLDFWSSKKRCEHSSSNLNLRGKAPVKRSQKPYSRRGSFKLLPVKSLKEEITIKVKKYKMKLSDRPNENATALLEEGVDLSKLKRWRPEDFILTLYKLYFDLFYFIFFINIVYIKFHCNFYFKTILVCCL